jgi:glyoxylase-like metal-dependent hydrolase (beta-lactamase superfamily II)
MGPGMNGHTMAPLPKETYATELYRFSHGSFDITVFSDGFITLPAEIILPDASPEERPALLKRLGGTADSAPYQVNIPLIRVGKDLILVDNGSGNKFQDSAGKLAANLKAAGVDLASITKVVFTHIHPDHAGGTILPDGTLMCPNAHYFVNDAEWQFWTDPDYQTNMPAALHDFARGSQRDMAAVQDRLTRFKPDDEIVSGMRVIKTRGHTPGHVSTSNILFFEHPDWHFGFDTEPEIALKSRRMFLDRAATEKIKMLGFHWVYPGVGYAERKGTAYQFVAD